MRVAKLRIFLPVSRATYRRLGVVGGCSAFGNPIGALRYRTCRFANVGPVDVRSNVLNPNRPPRRLLNLDCHRFAASALAVYDLPEVGDRSTDRAREGFPLRFAQIFEVRMKDVHGQNDSICWL